MYDNNNWDKIDRWNIYYNNYIIKYIGTYKVCID